MYHIIVIKPFYTAEFPITCHVVNISGIKHDTSIMVYQLNNRTGRKRFQYDNDFIQIKLLLTCEVNIHDSINVRQCNLNWKEP